MKTYDISIGERILLFRHRASLSKTQLAKRVGVTASTITNYEKGKSVPSQEILDRISFALNVSSNRIISGFDDPAKDMPEKPLIKQNPPA